MPTADTYLTVYPAGAPRPLASDLNLRRGAIRANLVTVQLGSAGAVDIYNRAGSVNVVADEVGYYSSSTSTPSQNAGQFHPVTPTRVIDTRIPGQHALPSHYAYFDAVSFPGAANSTILAAALNITVVDPATTGYVSTWDGTGAPPLASSVDFAAHETVPNLAIVALGPCYRAPACLPPDRQFAIYNGSSGAIHLVVDGVGFYDDNTMIGGLRFHPITPVRIADTRIGLGAASPLGPAGQASITLPTADVDPLTAAVALNVTAVTPSATTVITVWPSGSAKPLASNLNVPAAETVANAVLTGVGTTGAFDVFNANGTTNLLADLAGTFEAWPLAPKNTTLHAASQVGPSIPATGWIRIP